MQSSQNPTSTPEKPAFSFNKAAFSPFLTDPLKVQGTWGFENGSAFYSEKSNVIITSRNDQKIQFYNATTLLPLKEREPKEVDGVIRDFSYDEETDTFLFCSEIGSIYSYNVVGDQLEKLEKLQELQHSVFAAEFVSYPLYVFSWITSGGLHLRSLEDGDMVNIDFQDGYFHSLHYLAKSSLLVASLRGGSVRVYCPLRLKNICSVQAQEDRFYAVSIQSAIISGKEYVITATKDENVKIWSMRKGKMRLIRVIPTGRNVKTVVYLENYKMIAMAFEKVGYNEADYIEFWSILSGKLERKLDLNKHETEGMFLMKDKNKIGIPGRTRSCIEFVQLHPEDE